MTKPCNNTKLLRLTQEYPRLPTYPVYGTLNDTYDYFHAHVDPGFTVTTALVRVLCDLILRLADSALLPFNVRGYDVILHRGMAGLREHAARLRDAGLEMGEWCMLGRDVACMYVRTYVRTYVCTYVRAPCEVRITKQIGKGKQKLVVCVLVFHHSRRREEQCMIM